MTDRTPSSPTSPARRLFLFESAALSLSGVAVALLAGAPRLARGAGTHTANDVAILNAALAAEPICTKPQTSHAMTAPPR